MTDVSITKPVSMNMRYILYIYISCSIYIACVDHLLVLLRIANQLTDILATLQSHYESLATSLSEATVAPDAVSEFLDFFVENI